MNSKLISHQRVRIFFCGTALALLLIHNESSAQDQRRPRPNPADAVLKVQQLPPELEEILRNWERESKKINKLEGEHVRLKYDDVFQVEKRSKGKFYYEHPDKGRIDIEGMKIADGAKSDKLNKEGKRYTLKSGEDERWICDGKRIFAIHEKEKSYEVHPIPLERRGVNIMEGPLPFLFGMPAETAKKRYYLKLLINTPQQIVIAVKPRRRADAANYREAKVMLDPKTYLPSAVQLIHPGGGQSTVYSFKKVVANKKIGLFNIWWGKNPFTPKLDDYQLQGKVVAAAGENQAQQPVRRPAAPVQQVNQQVNQRVNLKVPSLIGKEWKKARTKLEDMGFKTKMWPGKAVEKPGEQPYHVYIQAPEPGTTAKAGDLIHLKLYTEAKPAQKQ